MKKDKYLNSFTISGEDMYKSMLAHGIIIKGKDEKTGKDVEAFYKKNDEEEIISPIYPNRNGDDQI